MYDGPIEYTDADWKLINAVELYLYRGRKCPSGPALAPLVLKLTARSHAVQGRARRWKEYVRRLRAEMKYRGTPLPNMFLAWREAKKIAREKVLQFVAEQRRREKKAP